MNCTQHHWDLLRHTNPSGAALRLLHWICSEDECACPRGLLEVVDMTRQILRRCRKDGEILLLAGAGGTGRVSPQVEG